MKEGKVDRRSRRSFRLFLCSHLPSLSLISVRSVRLFQIDFRSDCHFYSPLPPYDPSATKERLVCASRTEGRKAGRALLFSLSLSPVALGRSTPYFGAVPALRDESSILRACVRACGFSSRARIRAAYQERDSR